jgi:hypothetical protein
MLSAVRLTRYLFCVQSRGSGSHAQCRQADKVSVLCSLQVFRPRQADQECTRRKWERQGTILDGVFSAQTG